MQWVVGLTIAILVLAPGLIPPLARVAGRMVGTLGSHQRKESRVRRHPPRVVDANSQPLPPSAAERDERGLSTSMWLVGVLVASAVAVLSWWLLRTR